MRKGVVILGILLMLIGVLIFYSGSAVSTGEEALGWLIVGLPLSGLFFVVGFIVFVVGFILRKTIPVRMEHGESNKME